jgi:TldD protein
MKELADVALNAANGKGAQYADIRINRYRRQIISSREERIVNTVDTEDSGFGVRVLVDGTWGFASGTVVVKDDVARIAQQAVAVAKANRILQKVPVQLAPTKAFIDTWQTPILKDPFRIPTSVKCDLLLAINAEAKKAGASFCNSSVFAVREEKYFASTEGTYIDQLMTRVWPNFTVTYVDRAAGRFDTRAALTAPSGMGWEYVEGFPLLEEVKRAAGDVQQKSKAKGVTPGKKDLVLSPEHLWLTIHESVGHPTELDRALGYEANFAGTSFVTPEKLGKLQYASPIVNIVGDKTQPRGLATCGYDDEGVRTTAFDIIKDGKFVNYQTIREQAHLVGEKESKGCCYADNYSSVPFQRMPNVSLKPKDHKGQKVGWEELIADVKDGVLIEGAGSFSIDQQRYNFQFGGQVFWEIKDGKKGEMLRDVAYQSNTLEFWNSCDEIGSQDYYSLGGAFNDGKGQPSQSNSVSHGASWTRFRKVNVINTGRRI